MRLYLYKARKSCIYTYIFVPSLRSRLLLSLIQTEKKCINCVFVCIKREKMYIHMEIYTSLSYTLIIIQYKYSYAQFSFVFYAFSFYTNTSYTETETVYKQLFYFIYIYILYIYRNIHIYVCYVAQLRNIVVIYKYDFCVCYM